MECTVMSYNIERMKEFFTKGKVAPNEAARAQAAALTIAAVAPHILGIVEASDKLTDHECFINLTPLAGLNFQIAKSDEKRGKMDLVVYYREPFELVSLDKHTDFYNDWVEDIDQDSIDEVLCFERKPLEAEFIVRGTTHKLMIMLVSFKSKGVFAVADIHRYEHLALANRKKLYAQSMKVRQRVEQLLTEDPLRALIVMGDLNDEPGMDYFQKMVGASAVETLLGSLYEPDKILHNALWHLIKKGNPRDVWTTRYPDPIVANLKKHKAWLDHIFISPGMLKSDAPVSYIMNSGAIAEKTEEAASASDHFPVYCSITI